MSDWSAFQTLAPACIQGLVDELGDKRRSLRPRHPSTYDFWLTEHTSTWMPIKSKSL